MNHGSQRSGLAKVAARGSGPLALCMIFLPAAAQAEERRAALSVTAVVQAGCRVSAEDVRCSPQTRWSATAAPRRPARPIDDARSVLGAPVRRDGRIFFSAPAAQAGETAGDGNTASFLTITY